MEARGVSHVGGAMSSVCRTERSCPRVLTPDERRRPAEGTRPHGVNRRLRAPEKPTSNQDLTGQTDPWPGRGGAERNMHEPGPRRWSPHRGRRSGAQTHAHRPTRTDPRARTHATGPRPRGRSAPRPAPRRGPRPRRLCRVSAASRAVTNVLCCGDIQRRGHWAGRGCAGAFCAFLSILKTSVL